MKKEKKIEKNDFYAKQNILIKILCKVFETLPTLRVRGYTNNKVVNLCKQHQISYISTFLIHLLNCFFYLRQRFII